MFCPHCGQNNPPDSLFCTYCGACLNYDDNNSFQPTPPMNPYTPPQAPYPPYQYPPYPPMAPVKPSRPTLAPSLDLCFLWYPSFFHGLDSSARFWA